MALGIGIGIFYVVLSLVAFIFAVVAEANSRKNKDLAEGLDTNQRNLFSLLRGHLGCLDEVKRRLCVLECALSDSGHQYVITGRVLRDGKVEMRCKKCGNIAYGDVDNMSRAEEKYARQLGLIADENSK